MYVGILSMSSSVCKTEEDMDKASLAAGLIAVVQLSDQTIVPSMMKFH